MRLLGHGIDIVDIERFGNLAKSDRYLARCFTSTERRHSNNQVDRLAARFAAKEAVLKALNIGMVDGVSLKDIEITFAESGTPTVKLGGPLAERAVERGIGSWHISFSHGMTHAVASAIACSEEE